VQGKLITYFRKFATPLDASNRIWIRILLCGSFQIWTRIRIRLYVSFRIWILQFCCKIDLFTSMIVSVLLFFLPRGLILSDDLGSGSGPFRSLRIRIRNTGFKQLIYFVPYATPSTANLMDKSLPDYEKYKEINRNGFETRFFKELFVVFKSSVADPYIL